MTAQPKQPDYKGFALAMLKGWPEGERTMRVNVYSQELTPEVQVTAKKSNTGIVYRAVRLMLHSSPMLHHPTEQNEYDDDRSAITFWLPSSRARCEQMADAFEDIARRFRGASHEG